MYRCMKPAKLTVLFLLFNGAYSSCMDVSYCKLWDSENDYDNWLSKGTQPLLAHQLLSWALAGDIAYTNLIARIDKQMLGELAQKGNIYFTLSYISLLAQSDARKEQRQVADWLLKANEQLIAKLNNRNLQPDRVCQNVRALCEQTKLLQSVERLIDRTKDKQTKVTLQKFIEYLEKGDCGEEHNVQLHSVVDIFELGKAYYEGTAEQKNLTLALQYLQEVAHAQNDQEKEYVAQAAHLVGNIFAQYHAVKNKKKKKFAIRRDVVKAKKYYDQAIELGCSDALYDAGQLYYHESEYDEASQAFKCFLSVSKDQGKKACAYWCHGLILLCDQKIPMDEAMNAFTQAQDSVGIEQSFALFDGITHGKIFEALDKSCIPLLKKSDLDKNELDCCYFIGRLWYEGRSVGAKKRRDRGLQLLQCAADKGQEQAQLFFGVSAYDDIPLRKKFNYLNNVLNRGSKSAFQAGAEDCLIAYAKKGHLRPLWYLIQFYAHKNEIKKIGEKLGVVSFNWLYEADDSELLNDVQNSGFYDCLKQLDSDTTGSIGFFWARMHAAYATKQNLDKESIEHFLHAIYFLEQVRILYPKNDQLKFHGGNLYNSLGCAYLKNYQRDDGDTALSRAVDLGNIRAKGNIGQLFLESNNESKKKQGLQWLQEAAAAHDGNALANLGLYYFNNGDMGCAKQYFIKAKELGDKEVDLLLQLVENCNPLFRSKGKRRVCDVKKEKEARLTIIYKLIVSAGKNPISSECVDTSIGQAIFFGLNEQMVKNNNFLYEKLFNLKKAQTIERKLRELENLDEKEFSLFQKVCSMFDELGIKG